MKKKVFAILGTRPEIIKFSPLIPKLEKEFNFKVIFTGQHYSKVLTETIFKDLNLTRPDYNLKIGSGDHGKQTGKMLIEIEKIVLKEKPDAIIVQGDTNSTLAGALVGSKLNIKVIHIESGARCFNKKEPEEVNRIIVDHIADLNFSFSEHSDQALRKEGLNQNVYRFDNTVYEATSLNSKLIHKSKILAKNKLLENQYILATIHRASNTDSSKVLKNIVSLLNEISIKTKVFFPMHPRTRKILKERGLELRDNVIVTPPVGYLDMLQLIKNAQVILSDSGGVVDESAALNTPLIILREQTERVDIIRAGKAQLLNPNIEKSILLKRAKLKLQKSNLEKMRSTKLKYDKNVSTKMIKRISTFIK